MVKKISPDDLRIGMYVCGMERVEGKPIFFMNNILLKTHLDVEKMLDNGYASVYINEDEEPKLPEKAYAPEETLRAEDETEETSAIAPEEVLELAPAETCPEPEDLVEVHAPIIEAVEETAPVEAAVSEEEPGTTDAAPAATDFDEEIEKAKKIRDEAELLVREFLQNARLGKDFDAAKVTGTVGKMVDSVFRNQDALTSLARLKSFDDYTFAHSVNVCILSLAVGRHLGLERAALGDLGTGAILHDIGKMLVPGNILNKPGKLTDDEFVVMKRHTEFGGEVLSGARIKEASRLVALQHHERFDGTGYYRKIAGRDIHPFARIAAVADVYDAMTSKRVYQNGMPPEEALKRLYLMRGTHFEPELVERLIRCLGIYPIGTLVELNTGELAIVRMVSRSQPMQPRIEIVSDRKKKPIEKTVETELCDELGRWIISSRKPEEFTQFSSLLAS